MTSAWKSIEQGNGQTPYFGLYGNVCPVCSASAKVLDSRSISSTVNVIRRRRECKECGERFSTIEIREDDLQELILIKKYLAAVSTKLDSVENLNKAIKGLF